LEAEREGGRRRFTPAAVERLRVIATAKRAGLSLAEIGLILAATDAGAPVRAPVRALAIRKLPEVEAEVAWAERSRDWLNAAAACRCTSLESCGLLSG